MKKSFLAIGALSGFFAAAGLASAADLGATLSLGTTGIGAHLTVPFQQNLNGRFGLNYLKYDFDGNTSSINYDYKLKLNTVDALVDWYPSASNFRLTGGIVYNNNEITARGVPGAAGTYTIQGNTYSAATIGSVNGNVDFRRIAPYLGIGWGNAVKDKGWSFSSDLGVMFQGKPRSSLTSTGCTAAAAICTRLASDLARENAELADDAKDFRAYPVLRVGVSYKF